MLASLLMLVSAVSAHAVDTSGCSQMTAVTQYATTAQNNSVVATLARAPRTGCWNENNATITLEYRFMRVDASAPVAVTIWASVNGKSTLANAKVACGNVGVNYGKDTSGNNAVACVATITVAAPANGSVEVEVAPSVNGQSDTAGYGRNAVIRF